MVARPARRAPPMVPPMVAPHPLKRASNETFPPRQGRRNASSGGFSDASYPPINPMNHVVLMIHRT